jgi:peptidoglycan/LPS O-acetylase OafA/YrhL
MSNIQKYESLEALRGLAALVVFIGHLYVKIEGLPQISLIQILMSFALWGTEAVIIFFVLSGVVIYLSQEKRPKTVVEFAVNRLVRIGPLYIFSLILAAGVALFRGQAITPAETIGNLLFLQTLQGYIVGVLPTNEPLWSLSSEMFFYFLFALCLWNRKLAWVWCVAAVFSLVLYPVSLSLGWLEHLRLQLAFSCIWLMGYAIARLRHQFRFERSFAISLIPLALMCARTHFLEGYYDVYRFFAFALFLLPLFNVLISRSEHIIKVPWWIAVGCVLLSGALFLMFSKSILFTKILLSALATTSILLFYTFPQVFDYLSKTFAKAKPLLVYMGSISYALYITHMPILYFLQAVFPRHPLMTVMLTVGIVLMISHVLELILQPKITSWSKQRNIDRSAA